MDCRRRRSFELRDSSFCKITEFDPSRAPYYIISVNSDSCSLSLAGMQRTSFLRLSLSLSFYLTGISLRFSVSKCADKDI